MQFNTELDLLFETSWEVCNKIGGIYAVLSTKAKTLQRQYKDKVIFIGPDVWSTDNPSPYFTENKTLTAKFAPALSPIADVVPTRVGRWNVPGKPIVILVDFSRLYAVKDALYGKMWELYGVDSLHAYGDYDEACAFSHAAAKVIEAVTRYAQTHAGAPIADSARGKEKSAPTKIIAHFDEWTTGMGLLITRWRLPEIATVFTTHATCIGRSICGNGKPLYDYLKAYNGDQMAAELNMQSKHSLEKAAAHAADCFTTVSEVTAAECEQLLKIRPAVVTPNGFENSFVPPSNKMRVARANARRRMLEVASALCGKKFDDETFIIATSGRGEYRNKGLDVFCDVMAQLQYRQTDKQAVAFIMVPAWCEDPRSDLQASLATGMYHGLPDRVLTHTLHNFDSDIVNMRLHELGFASDNPHSRVSVVYVPCYLNGDDGIFDMQYYELLPGLDASVFASYYEPWGYTPLESVAFGTPTVTTSLSGFGQWVLDNFENNFDACGVHVVARGDNNYGEVVSDISNQLQWLIELDPAKRPSLRAAARHTAAAAEWKNFIKYYDQAYAIAVGAASDRTNNK